MGSPFAIRSLVGRIRSASLLQMHSAINLTAWRGQSLKHLSPQRRLSSQIAHSTVFQSSSTVFDNGTLPMQVVQADDLPIVSLDDRKVAIGWDTQKWSRFHNIWLRDHCRCSQCFHPVTKQRLLDTFEASPAHRTCSVSRTHPSNLLSLDTTGHPAHRSQGDLRRPGSYLAITDTARIFLPMVLATTALL
jgi:hypothetical protein